MVNKMGGASDRSAALLGSLKRFDCCEVEHSLRQ